MSELTPQQRVRWMILKHLESWGETEVPVNPTGEQIDDLYSEEEDDDNLTDARTDFRQSGVETGLDVYSSRHYECDTLAIKCPDGVWVAWAYWHGGGKFGQAECIDFIEGSFLVECVEKQVVKTVCTFTDPRKLGE